MRQTATKTSSEAVVLLSPLFLVALGLLLLNDFYLKNTFGNGVTSKLSDFSGLFAFPFFVASFWPKRRNIVYFVTAIAFCLWKSPLSQVLIESINSHQIITIGRIVDYTDLIALAVLPLSLYYFDHVTKRSTEFHGSFKRALAASTVLIASFAFMATQFVDDRSVSLESQYEFGSSRLRLVDRLRKLKNVRKIDIRNDTDIWPANEYPDVKTDPQDYSLRFEIVERYCDSNHIELHTGLHDNGDTVTMNYISIRYWCPEAPGPSDQQKLISILERTVVEPLQGTVVK